MPLACGSKLAKAPTKDWSPLNSGNNQSSAAHSLLQWRPILAQLVCPVTLVAAAAAAAVCLKQAIKLSLSFCVS